MKGMGMASALGALAVALLLAVSPAVAGQVEGFYLEARTCQVYTGPCFANAEVGLSGRGAIMAWHIDRGEIAGVDVSGLNVVVVVRSSDTLGFQGLEDARELKSLVLLDQNADANQRQALLAFVRDHAGRAGRHIVSVRTMPIAMELDPASLKGRLDAAGAVRIETRKANPNDCICGNETAYYPPLVALNQFAAGITVENQFRAPGLGTQWSAPESRSAYVGLFQYSTN